MDLITNVDLKVYLKETGSTYDALFALFIKSVSVAINKYIGCELIAASYSWALDGSGSKLLWLPAWPITTLTSVTEDGALLVEGEDGDYRCHAERGYLEKLEGTWSKGFKNVGVAAKAGYDETHTISAFADYSGTVAGTVKATSALHGFSVGTTANVVITGTANYNGTYTVTYIDANSFYFTATFVATETGLWNYPTMPEDIRFMVFHKIARMWKEQKSGNWGETSRSIAAGNVSFYDQTLLNKEEKEILEPYRRKIL